MDEKNTFNSRYGIIVVTVLGIACFFIGMFVINNKNNGDDSNSNGGSSNTVDKVKDKTVIEDDEVDDSIKNKISEVIEKYYNEIFVSHSSAYCGDVEVSAAADEIYFKNKSYNSISDIASYYGTIVSKKYFENNLKDMFIEENGNLYCKMFNGASLEYEKNSFSILSIRKSGDGIIVQGSYKTLESDLNPSESYNALISFVNENGAWVIDLYEEVK